MKKSKDFDCYNEENGFCCDADSICSCNTNNHQQIMIMSVAALGIIGIVGAVAFVFRPKKSLITI